MTIKIGLVDADLLDGGTRHPNLAQMKIARYCIEQGCETSLLFGDKLADLEQYDLIIISKVFDYTKLPANFWQVSRLDEKGLRKINLDVGDTVDAAIEHKKHPHIIIGGTGFFFDDKVKLPDRIEHIMPYYDLYLEFIDYQITVRHKTRSYYKDYLDFSIGFTTRGCFRHCPFCVNRNSNKIVKHSPVREFFEPSRPKIYLWDDNFLGFSGWKQILEELEEVGRPFQFRQGLDMRLMTAEKAQALSKSKYYGDFIFAFDHIEDKDVISKKLTIWRKYCHKETKLYVLTGFDAWNADGKYPMKGEEEDVRTTFERIAILMKFYCLPYVMRHKDFAKGEFKGVYTQLARWCNQPSIFKKMSFRQFCERNQYYAGSDKPCASVRAFRLLEERLPDVVEKYCDLRFEDFKPGYVKKSRATIQSKAEFVAEAMPEIDSTCAVEEGLLSESGVLKKAAGKKCKKAKSQVESE